MSQADLSATGPVVRVGMAPRATGLSMAGAQEHWRTAHRDVALGIPGLRAYVQNHQVIEDGRPLLAYPGFDVCAETEFDDVAAMRAGFASEHYQGAVRADETTLIDGSRFMLAITRRRVLLDAKPATDAVKLITLLRAHPASTREALLDALAGPYAEAVAEDVRPLRHEQLITLPEAHVGDLPNCCDAVDLLWFPDAMEALAALRGPLAERPGWILAGRAFGSERLIAKPIRQR
jgi:uncharacterized protein (TIGR02118 family)